MAMHLTGHSDDVTSFCDPVLLPYAIGQFSEAGMYEWLPFQAFVIFHTRSRESITSGPISE